MDLEPPNLNIPLEKKDPWGLWMSGACVGTTTVLAFINPTYAIVFGATSMVGLPVFLLLFFPGGIASRVARLGQAGRVALAFFVMAYLSLAKTVLVPGLVSLIETGLQR